MKIRVLFLLLAVSISASSFATVWTITTSGFKFTPANITIMQGDSVRFVMDQSHNAREINQDTYNTNGTTAKAGGFQVAFGGGLLLPADLVAGTHYYICTNHAASGMKGIITVQDPSGISSNNPILESVISPNPNTGNFKLELLNTGTNDSYQLVVIDITGRTVFSQEIKQSISNITLPNPLAGTYMVRISRKNAVLTKKLIIQ